MVLRLSLFSVMSALALSPVELSDGGVGCRATTGRSFGSDTSSGF